jgi:[ribosomal protein S5]-alanine N-acetyltransferase
MPAMSLKTDLEATRKGAWFTIHTKKGIFCGAGGFNDLNQEHRKAEIGFWLLKKYWGRGIMKEVMPSLFAFGFTELNLNRIEAHIETNNHRCIKAIEKLNFTYEGIMRDCEIKNDVCISLAIYSILESEWNLTSTSTNQSNKP